MNNDISWKYGKIPLAIGKFDIKIPEMMRYLYLPVRMGGYLGDVRLPNNIECLRPLIMESMDRCHGYEYCYVSAQRGIASPGNALNRPGWHCDGFGTDDRNAIWWDGPGTRFAVQDFSDISADENESLDQFDAQVASFMIQEYSEHTLYLIDPFVVHAVPIITEVCDRSFVKISFSDQKYNLEGNSHNYLFDYSWEMKPRHSTRNITSK